MRCCGSWVDDVADMSDSVILQDLATAFDMVEVDLEWRRSLAKRAQKTVFLWLTSEIDYGEIKYCAALFFSQLTGVMDLNYVQLEQKKSAQRPTPSHVDSFPKESSSIASMSSIKAQKD